MGFSKWSVKNTIIIIDWHADSVAEAKIIYRIIWEKPAGKKYYKCYSGGPHSVLWYCAACYRLTNVYDIIMPPSAALACDSSALLTTPWLSLLWRSITLPWMCYFPGLGIPPAGALCHHLLPHVWALRLDVSLSSLPYTCTTFSKHEDGSSKLSSFKM